jgi:ABC-type multidrug transport system permease subunit
LDWSIAVLVSAVFLGVAIVTRVPPLALNWIAVTVLSIVLLIFLAACGSALWKRTRFS